MAENLKYFGIVLIVVFGVQLFYFQYVNIERPKTYDRKDYYMSIGGNRTIKMNCFDFPGVPFSTYFLYRLKESEGKILLQKDSLVCDFYYSNFKNNTPEEVDVWLTNDVANYLEERKLNLNSGHEQIIFPLTASGNYGFELLKLENDATGWEELLFPNIKFYVYASVDSYSSDVKSYNSQIATSLSSFIGLILGVMALLIPQKRKY